MNHLKKGHDVIGISGVSDRFSDNIPNVKLYSPNKVNEIRENPDIVILCHAAVSSGNIDIESKLLFEANVNFTKQILQFFPTAYHLFISSVAVYGDNKEIINENTAVNPATEYAVSKLWGELIVSNIPTSGILRLTSIYGEGMRENTIIPHFVNQALKNGKIEVWGDGIRKQNYLYISDAITYVNKMIENKISGLYIAASKDSYSNRILAEIISNLSSSKIIFRGIDNSSSRLYDNSQSKLKLQIESECNLTEGLNKYIKWNKKQF